MDLVDGFNGFNLNVDVYDKWADKDQAINEYGIKLIDQPKEGKYDAILSIDVIEHLEPEFEKPFMENQINALNKEGILITGTPNVTASQYATFRSDHQHINLKSAKELKNLLDKYFHNSFVFSMNDEVVHTGYHPMAHYLMAFGVGKK